MERLILVLFAIMSVHTAKCEEASYGTKLKREADRLMAEIQSVGRELRDFMLSKKEQSGKIEKTAGTTVACASDIKSAVVEACDHCKNLCGKDQEQSA